MVEFRVVIFHPLILNPSGDTGIFPVSGTLENGGGVGNTVAHIIGVGCDCDDGRPLGALAVANDAVCEESLPWRTPFGGG